ncbi:formin isoform X1 [Sphaeramia orbicularis]|uniref:formin isoform X1 n=1 Tax=Sphaeramia orbicularis TaxID=375764 RepID=UPI001180C284|nr:formin-1 isoform X1 [Sphaeramia orbicularis]
MEGSHSIMELYMPIMERSCVSRFLPLHRGPASPSKAPLKHQRGLTSSCKEEGWAGSVKQGQADKLGPADFTGTHKAADDSSEILWLTELLLLCSDCQAFMNMGNQQGTKINLNSFAESWDSFSKSPNIQIPQKRRRRTEGRLYTGNLQHNLKMMPGTLWAPSKARRLTKLRMMNSPAFGDTQKWEEERPIICTPEARRKRRLRKEKEQRNASVLEESDGSLQDLAPPWREKSTAPASVHFSKPFSTKAHFAPKKDVSIREELSFADSETDLSEYDNEMYSTCTSESNPEPKSTRNSPESQATIQTQTEKEVGGVEKSSLQMLDEMGKKAATLRVMGKIEEVEGIIRRVSLTSLDWIKENREERDENHRLHELLKQRPWEESSAESKDGESADDRPLFVEELRALGEALSQSLHQALRMEGENTDWRPTITHIEPLTKTRKTYKRPHHLPLKPHFNYSLVPNSSSSPSLSNSSMPSPSLSSILNTSTRTSSSFGCSPPILSPLFSSESQIQTDQHEATTPEWIKQSRGFEKTTRLTSGEKTYQRKKKDLDWVNLGLSEQYQTHSEINGFTSDTEDSQRDLLLSDEALQRQEEIWQQEVEESLSFCRSLSHPSRPKHVDFLRITAPEDDILDTPAPTPPLPPEPRSETSTPGEGEERTPGRLQAVWPPLKEEKVGLKYTEAEHQAALLQLKRECKEELEKLQEDYGHELSRLKEENEENIAHLESTIAELQVQLSQAGTRSRGEVRDIAVSTGDDFVHKSFRTVCIQTDRETFVKTPEDEKGRVGTIPQQQRETPKKLDLTSISLSLAGQRDDSSQPEPPSYSPPGPPSDPLAPSQSSTKTDPLPPPPPPNNISLPPPPPPPPPPLPAPPPPPFMPGLAPPPPPPPPGGALIMDKPPRKPAVEPSRPMKPLYWSRIQVQENNKDTLWNILEELNIINTSEFEDLFAKTTTQTKRKPLSDAYEKKAKARKIIKLLDGKRSQAVGILISSLHLEMKDIQQAVLTVDHSVVDLETIEALYENRAQPEELERIKKHYETSNEEEVKLLDKPEQFLYELSQIPDFAGRAHCIIFQSAFIDGVTSIQQKLNTVFSVCKVLLDSVSVREVMGLVLALGNHMNGGSRTRGQADGFGLEILPKLKDVKSRDNRISLGDYVVSYYLRNVDKNAGTDKSAFPLPEPQDVFLAAQVKFDDLNRDLRQLGRDLTRCEKGVQEVCSYSPEEHLQPFKDKMEAFVLSARKEHAEVSYQLMTVQKSFQDLVLYFGVKPKTGEKEVTTSHFFMLWFEFCADFKARWKRENKNISKERLKEAQLSVKRITSEKKVETRKINPNSLKERLRQKEANMASI